MMAIFYLPLKKLLTTSNTVKYFFKVTLPVKNNVQCLYTRININLLSIIYKLIFWHRIIFTPFLD